PRARTVYQINLEVMKQLTTARAERRRTLAPAAYREFIIDGLRKSLCWDVAKTSGNEQPRDEQPRDERRHDEQRRSKQDGPSEPRQGVGREKQSPQVSRVLLVADDEAERASWSAELTRLGVQVRAPLMLRASDREELMTGLPRVAWWARQILGVSEIARDSGVSDSLGDGEPASQRGGGAPAATAPTETKAAAAEPVEPTWLAIGPAASYAVQAAALLGPRPPRQVIAVRGLDALERACSGPDVYHSLLAWPGVWRWLDETDLAAALAGVNLWLAAPRSAAGDRMSESEWRQRYAWSSDRHAQAGSRLRLDFALPTPAEVARALA
ncbi:MAG TPA: hypothetical protein PLV92_23120, partial [Pirellulaceae bacterium]|nr:hypothetical protein [Pirellulaceae bacterium]